MYVPAAFRVDDLPALHDFIEQYSFGLLVSSGEGGLTGSHLPFILDRQAGPQGTLIGHVAKANRQWEDSGREVLAVFSGPHAYISPTWYATPNTVPTWNYVAVHATGILELIHDPDELMALLQHTVKKYESGRQPEWTLDPGSEFNRQLLSGIVGFRIAITKLEGKWKLNQNHPVERRERVIAALQNEPHEDARKIADLMQQTLPSASSS